MQMSVAVCKHTNLEYVGFINGYYVQLSICMHDKYQFIQTGLTHKFSTSILDMLTLAVSDQFRLLHHGIILILQMLIT